MRLPKFFLTAVVTLSLAIGTNVLPVEVLHPSPQPVPAAVAQTPPDRKAEADRLFQQGIQQYQISQFREALQYWEQALAIYQQIGDRQGIANSLGNLGLAYDSLGDYQQAIKYHQQGLDIMGEIGDRSGIATFLGNLGAAYNSLGDYQQAIKYHQQSLDIARKIDDSQGIASSLVNLGAAYNSLGDYQQAINYHQQSLDIAREIGYPVAIASSLVNLGIAYTYLGDYQQAINYHQQSLAIARKIGDRQGIASSLVNLGNAYYSLGDYQQAIQYHQQSLDIAREIGYRQGIAASLVNLGIAYDSLGNYQQAIKYHQQGLDIMRDIGDRFGEGASLNNLGLALFKSGQLQQAEKALRDAIEVRESLRQGLEDKDKVSIADTQINSYRTLQQVLIARNNADAALEISERGRARAFVELLAARLSSNSAKPSKVNPPNMAEIRQIAKERQATLVEYSIIYDKFKIQGREQTRESDLYIWVIQPTGKVTFRQVDLKPLWQQQNTSLAQLVKSSREAILNEENATPSLQQLYQLLVQSIADLLPADPEKPVIFIPQYSLNLLPFPALQDASGKYLIEKHAILTAPSIQVLQLTRQKGISGPEEVLVLGNPTMPIASLTVGKPPQQLLPLPDAEKEAKAIAQLLDTTAITGDAGTKAAILQKLPSARIVHLATHGILDDIQGLQSAIALAPAASPKTPSQLNSPLTANSDSALLTADEILDLKLNAELVVLSACETGRGKITGDGVIGLSRSWISAGARSVVVSLWQVNDGSTADLMNEFYRNLQHSPDAAAGLRKAMLSTLALKSYQHPRYWAAFTLIGESEAPFLSQRHSGFPFIWAGGAIAVLAGIAGAIALKDKFVNLKLPRLPLPSSRWQAIALIVTLSASAAILICWQYAQPLTYQNAAYGIKLQYPREWTIQEPQDAITGTVAVFLSPPENNASEFQNKLTVSVEDLSSNPKDLASYTKDAIQEIQMFLPEVEAPPQANDGVLAGLPAQQFFYVGKAGNDRVQRMQIWAIKNNKAYTITYEAKADKFSAFLRTAQEMIKSFEIQGS